MMIMMLMLMSWVVSQYLKLGLFFQELDKVSETSVTWIIHWALLAWLEESESWESLDWHLWVLISSGIHFGNGDLALEWSDFLGKLLVDWLKRLAVSTPRSIGFQEHKLSAVQNSLLEVVTNNNEDWLVIFGRNAGWLVEWLFDLWLNVLKSFQKTLSTDVLNSVLLKVLSNELDQDSLVSLTNAQVISKLLSESLGDLWQREN